MTHFLGVNYSKGLEDFAKNFIEERNRKGCWFDQEGNGSFGIFDPPFCMSTVDKFSSSATDWRFPYWEFDKSTLGWDQVLEKLFDTEYINDSLKADREIVLAAVKQNGSA